MNKLHLHDESVILAALSNYQRWSIVKAISQHGPQDNAGIQKLIGATQPYVSVAFRTLRKAGILKKENRFFYSLVNPDLLDDIIVAVEVYSRSLRHDG